MKIGAWWATDHVVTKDGCGLATKQPYIYPLFFVFFWDWHIYRGFSGGSDDNESASSAKDLALIPRLGRSPGKVNGYPLQYSCLENSIDRGALAWWAIVHGVTRSQT